MSTLERLDIDLLTALDALLATRNVTRAAATLGMSQPALSARLTRLREVFADRLFLPAPNGRGVVPTPRAVALAPMVSVVLDQMRAMLEPAGFDPITSTRTFTVALHENPAVMLTPDLVPRVQIAAPHVRLVLTLPAKDKMSDLLERGDVDLFIGVRAQGDKAWLSRTLFEDAFATAQRKHHPRGASALDLDAFCAAVHLLVSSEGDSFFGMVDDALLDAGRSRTVSLSLQSYAVAPTIAATSDLLCTLPRRFLQRYTSTLDLFEPPIALPAVEVTAFWHRRSQDDPGHRWLRSQLFAAAAAIGRRV